MRGRRCIGRRAHPQATASTTPCHRPAQAVFGHRSQGDERQGDLRRPCSWLERATEMKKYAEEQQNRHQDQQGWAKVHKPHKDKDREKPREKKVH